MIRVSRALGCGALLCLALSPAATAAADPAGASGDPSPPADAAPTANVASQADADTVTYGSCPDDLEAGPSDVPGVAWGDTVAAADRLAAGREAAALGDLPVDSLLRLGDRAAAAGHHTTAYAAYAAAVRTGGGYESLWKAAGSAVDVGQDLSADAAEAWYGVAEGHGRSAVEARAGAPEGHFHLAQALGLVALDAGTRERVQLSEEIRREARAAIEADSSYAGGWHVLGRWHRGVMELSGAGRFFARTFLGGDVLGEASWDAAIRHLERAAELEPGRMVHHLELGRVYRDRDRPDAARQQLRTVLELAPRDYHDCVYRRQARQLLDETGDG